MTKKIRAVQSLVLLGALSLSACGGPTSSRDMYRGERKGTLIEEPRATISPQRKAAIQSLGLDQQAKPAKLVGMSQFDIKKALGEPSFVRRDDGVEIWQYRAENCILDLFLYDGREGMRVDHSELRGPILDSAGELSCFQSILLGPTS